jgi:predicted O-linked N-acetylglucosamine transferase (SPINDLY family)
MCEFSESKMLLYNTRFKDETKQSVLEEFAKRGVDRDRVQVQSGAPQVDYLEAYHEIDVALDVTPWAGATTTLGALWMGVPVVAFDGGRRSARSTVAIVNAIGQSDWAAKTNECYVETVASLCSDLSVLEGIRQGLRSQLEATVLNAKRFTRELESQYRKAWQKRAEA